MLVNEEYSRIRATSGGVFTSMGITDVGNIDVRLGASAFDADKTILYNEINDGVPKLMAVKLGTLYS